MAGGDPEPGKQQVKLGGENWLARFAGFVWKKARPKMHVSRATRRQWLPLPMIGGKKLKFAEADNDSSSLVQRAIIDEPLVVVLVPKLRI